MSVRSVARPRPPSRVLVDRRRRQSRAVRRQLAAAGDADRVVALLEQHPLRADPDRERQPRELPERAGARRPAARAPAPDRVGDRALEADARAARVVGPGLHERAAAALARRGRTSRARRRPVPARRASRSRRLVPTSPSVEPSTEASTSVLRDGPPLEHARRAPAARRCPRRCRRRRARGTRRARRATTICRREAPARRADDVLELAPGVLEAVALDLEAAPAQRGGDRRAATARSPATARRAVRRALGQVGRALPCQAPVEQHVRRQSLRQRPRPALQREHRQHDREQRRNEGRTVDPRLDHRVQPTILDGDGLGPPHLAGGRRDVRSRSC